MIRFSLVISRIVLHTADQIHPRKPDRISTWGLAYWGNPPWNQYPR